MNTDQIAEEAAKEISGKLKHANVMPLWIKDIIKAAIEKATEALRDKHEQLIQDLDTDHLRHINWRDEKIKRLESRAAHASEDKLPHDWNKDLPIITHLTQPARASEPAQPAIIGGRRECPKCGEDYSMSDIHDCRAARASEQE